MGFQAGEYVLVGSPPVEYGVWVPPQVPGCRGGNALEEGSIVLPSHHNAEVTVPSQQYAKPSRVEVEGIRARHSPKGMPGDEDLELQALEAIGRVHDDSVQVSAVQDGPNQVLLIIVGYANGHVGDFQGSPPPLAL